MTTEKRPRRKQRISIEEHWTVEGEEAWRPLAAAEDRRDAERWLDENGESSKTYRIIDVKWQGTVAVETVRRARLEEGD